MLTFYTIKNLDTGQYLCRVPQNKHEINKIWTDDIQDIKVYPKPGPARGAITTVSRICYDNDLPKSNLALIQLDTTETVLDEGARVASAVQKIRKGKQNQQNHRAYSQILALHQRMANDAMLLRELQADIPQNVKQ